VGVCWRGLTGVTCAAGGVGVDVAGADVAGVVVAVGAAETSAGWEAGAGFEAAGAEAFAAGEATTRGASTWMRGALARRIGIAGPEAEAVGLADSCSRGALAGRSARPIKKQHANTAAHSNAVSPIVRAYSAARPSFTSSGLATWIVFMTDTRAA